MNPILIYQLIERWSKKSPMFFRTLQWIFGVLALLCFGVVYVLGYLEIYAEIKDLASNIGTFSLGIALTSKFTKDDKAPDTNNQ